MPGPWFSDSTHGWMPDLNGVMQQVVFDTPAQQRRVWQAAWVNIQGVDPTQSRTFNYAGPSEDYCEFPGKFGTYEYVTAVLANLRAQGL